MISRKISGFITNGDMFSCANVEVRFSSDRNGETLSLQVGNLMITVPYEPVKYLIQQERKKRGKK